MISIIDCLLTPRDVVVYDAEAHACIIDGLRLHKGKTLVFGHNDMESLRLQLQHATDLAEEQNGGVLVITEGVFGMKGDLGKLDEIVALKKDFQFRLLVDDAHGLRYDGPGRSRHGGAFRRCRRRGRALQHLRQVDGRIGAFVSGPRWLINLLRYNMRSQLRQVAPDADGDRRAEASGADPQPPRIPGETLGERPCAPKQPERERVRDRCDQLAGDARLPEGRHSRGHESGRGPAREPRYFCSMVVYPVIPKGQMILRMHPDGGAYAGGCKGYD